MIPLPSLANAAPDVAPRIRIHRPADAMPAGGVEDTGLGDAALLPRLAPSAAKTLNRLYASGLTFEFRVGDAVWHASWDPDPAPLSMPRHYRFQLGDASGHLVLDPFTERRLLGDAAADVVPPDLRSLLLADALEPVFPAIERHTGQPFRLMVSDDQNAVPLHPQATYLHLRVQQRESEKAFRCAISFDEERSLDLLFPAAATPRAAATEDAEEWSWMPVPLAFRLGATVLKLEELRSIAPGDIVRIDTWRSVGKGLVVSASPPGTARCAITARAVDATIIVDRIEENTLNTRKTTDAIAEQTQPDALLNDLDALEVTLTFELGSHNVTLGELRTLQPGYAIELAQPLQRCTIRILANGRAVGNGHLIALGDKLGIRVSEFARSDDV